MLPVKISLRWQLMLLMSVALAPLVLLFALFAFAVVQEEDLRRDQLLARESQRLAAAVGAKLQSVVAKLHVLGASATLAEGNLSQFYELASQVLEADPSLSNLLLTGPEGEHLVNLRLPYGTALPPLNRPDLPRAAAEGRRALVTDFEQGVLLGRPLTAVYVPVVKNDRVRFVIGAALEESNWGGLLRSEASPGVFSALVDKHARLIGTTEAGLPTQLLPQQVKASASAGRILLASVPQHLQRTSRTPDLAEWTVLSYAPPGQRPFSVVPHAAATFFGFAVVAVTALLVALKLGASTRSAIESLVTSVKRVAEGHPPTPVSTRIREIDEAAEALTATASALAASLRESSAARTELQTVNERQMEFLAALGHELRNPLGAIRNAVQLARRSSDAERVAWAHAAIDRQSTQMAHLVDELFDLSRLQRGKVTLHLEPVELGSLVRHVAEDSREEFGKRGIELVVDAAETVVRGDATKLTQVLANLLHNAMKFTAAGGTVEVSVRDDGQAAVLTVSDTGAGIEPGALATIFDPFRQGRDAEAGLGLGLYLVRMLCELHAGSVSAHSAGKGQGARFEVRLPVTRGAAQQAPPPSTT